RRELEDRVRGDELRLAGLAHTESVEQDDVVAVDDGDRKPGHELLVHDLVCELLELRQGCHDLLPSRHLCEGSQGSEQRRGPCEHGSPEHRTLLITTMVITTMGHRSSVRPVWGDPKAGPFERASRVGRTKPTGSLSTPCNRLITIHTE